ncbi:MAG: N-acetylmuramoyl-L-alanine amidase [Bacteroidetes bacterium]|nr:N-acetylmuramoyl-L-alanine amidase [Bacteroidota bacterium]
MKTPILLSLGLLAFLTSSFQPLNFVGNKLGVVVIDAGHGGKDPGAISGGLREKDVTLAVALRLGQLIKSSHPEIKVYYTRMSDNFIELNERSSIANRNKADLFISIHVNHSDNSSAHGSETYVMGTHKNAGNLEVAKRENASILLEDDYQKDYEGFDPNSPEGHIIFSFYQNAFLEQSILLASEIEDELAKRKKINRSRGVKQAGFLVLWKTTMPSVLVETGFMTNSEERGYLKSEAGKDELAESIFKAFESYKKEVEK